MSAPDQQKPQFFAAVSAAAQPRLLDRVREKIRLLHYSKRTEEAYVGRIRKFILFHGKRHPETMGAPEVERFLTHLAVVQHVAASTQNQALCAILFLYKVLEQPLPLLDAVRAKRPDRLPTMLSIDEIRHLFAQLPQNMTGLMADLLYGTGMRLLECCRLRAKDIDFARCQIIVREGKGDKDRAVPLPVKLRDRLEQQVERVRGLHEADLQQGFGHVYLPTALAAKYPHATRELGWQSFFPSARLRSIPMCCSAGRPACKARWIDSEPFSGRSESCHVLGAQVPYAY